MIPLLRRRREEEGRLVRIGDEERVGARSELSAGLHADVTRYRRRVRIRSRRVRVRARGVSEIFGLHAAAPLHRLGPVPKLLAQQSGLARLIIAVERGDWVKRSARLALPARHPAVENDKRSGVFLTRERHATVLFTGLFSRGEAVVHQTAPLLLPLAQRLPGHIVG